MESDFLRKSFMKKYTVLICDGFWDEIKVIYQKESDDS